MQTRGRESYRKMHRPHGCKQSIWNEKLPATWTLHGRLGVLTIPHQNSFFLEMENKRFFLVLT